MGRNQVFAGQFVFASTTRLVVQHHFHRDVLNMWFPCSVGPSPWAHYTTKGQMDTGPEAWLSKLNQAFWAEGMDRSNNITMDMFNASLAEVNKLQKHYYMVLNKQGDKRFHKAACEPPDKWQQGCFCPLDPCTHKDRVNMIRPEQFDPAAVAWAHHLAALLRLMPAGEHRKAYMTRRKLMDSEKAFALFLSGPPKSLTPAAFKEIMGSLEPPVIVAGSHQMGVGGKDGRQQVAWYRLDLDISEIGAARRAIVQMTMAFHQRMVDWPENPSHRKRIPWVMGRMCNLSMIHHPLLIVELALAAWGMKVEEAMLDLELNAKEIFECNLGLLERSGHKVFKQRTAAAASLNECLDERTVAHWVQSSAPSDGTETDLWGIPISPKQDEELQASDMCTENHPWQTAPEQSWVPNRDGDVGPAFHAWQTVPRQWLNYPPWAGDMHGASHEWQTGPDQWYHGQPWAGKGNMGTASHGWQTGFEQWGNEQPWAGHEHGYDPHRMQQWPTWDSSDDGGRAERYLQPKPEEPDTGACENREAASFASSGQDAQCLLQKGREDSPLSNQQLDAQRKLVQARARMRHRETSGETSDRDPA